MLEEIIERLMSPDKFSIFLFTLGFSLIVSVTGVVRGLKFLGISAPLARSRKEKLLIGMAGIVLVVSGVAKSLSLAVYVPAISAKQIYTGNDAKQIVADGEDVYLLKRNGNVFRISQNRLEPVDLSEDNVRISPAGGTLYILKDNGNILSYVSVSGRVPAEDDPIQLKDDGTRTQQILAAGPDLYIRSSKGRRLPKK